MERSAVLPSDNPVGFFRYNLVHFVDIYTMAASGHAMASPVMRTFAHWKARLRSLRERRGINVHFVDIYTMALIISSTAWPKAVDFSSASARELPLMP